MSELIKKEIPVDGFETIMCKFDVAGVIEYANDYFMTLSEYSLYELMGKKINFLYNENMPRVITEYAWNKILNKEKTNIILKCQTKSKKFYWLEVKLDLLINPETRKVENVFFYGKAANRNAILELDIFYTKLYEMEQEKGLLFSKQYLENYLEEQHLNYNDFMNKYLRG